MSAEIFTLPGARPPVRLVFSSTTKPEPASSAYALRQLAEANAQIIGAQSDIACAIHRLSIGQTLPDHDATITGEALESILRGALAIFNLSGASNRDRGISRELRQWLQVNGSSDK